MPTTSLHTRPRVLQRSTSLKAFRLAKKVQLDNDESSVIVEGVSFELVPTCQPDSSSMITPTETRPPPGTPFNPSFSPQEILTSSPTLTLRGRFARNRRRAESESDTSLDASHNGRSSGEETRKTYVTPPSSAAEEIVAVSDCEEELEDEEDDCSDLPSTRFAQYAVLRPATPTILRRPPPSSSSFDSSRPVTPDPLSSGAPASSDLPSSFTGWRSAATEKSLRPEAILSFLELESPVAPEFALNGKVDEKELRRQKMETVRQWVASVVV